MAQSVEEVLPRIRSLAKRYAGPCITAEDLESVGALAFLEAEKRWDGTGNKQAFALDRCRLRMVDAVRDAVTYTAGRVLYDALSTTTTIAMLRKHAVGGSLPGLQDESAYVSEIMGRIETSALGKMLFVESLSGKVSCRAESKRRRLAKSRWAHARALKDAKTQAAELVADDS